MDPSPKAWIVHHLAVDLLRTVSATCRSAAVPFLVVKGAATSRLLYADVAERPMLDVDVRIAPRDFARFRRMAAGAAWPAPFVSRVYRNLVYPFPGLSLEVEAAVGPPGLCALSVDAMLARALPLDLGPDLRVLAPDVHDHAVLLVVNVFKDKLSAAMPWALADVGRIARHPSFDPSAFVERALSSRIATIAWIVASFLESTRPRDPTPWSAVRSLLERRAPLRRAYARLVRSLLPRGPSNPLSLRLLARLGADSLPMRAEALAAAFAWDLEMRLRRSIAPRDS